MEDPLIKALPSAARLWLAHAVAGIILADGEVEPSELEYLREVINFLENAEDINHLVTLVKNKEKVILQSVRMERKAAARVLLYLANIVVSDSNLSPAEADFFKYVGTKLGFNPKFSEEVLGWARDFMNVNKKRKALLKRAERE